ncbi:CU044_5270 family protein [Spirillospora sp. NPDC048819]|uniref:CU044_5270 family protein n=1 Tax=Spirillospora sp. NPDC048819 TaxID=3155268 RepID=UPI0034005C86
MKPHSTDELVRSMARVRDESLAGFAGRPAARALVKDVMAAAPNEGSHAETAAWTPAGGEPVKPERPRRRFRLPRLGVRLVAAGALAAMAAGVIVLADDDGRRTKPPLPPDIPLGSVAQAAHVLDQAAKAAETRPFTLPKPRQWVYTKMRLTTSANAGGLATGGPYKTNAWELWRRVDGRQFAAYKDGKVQTGPELGTPSTASEFDPLPSDPEALLRKVGGSEGYYDLAYERLVTILRESVQSPEREAAIFRAIKLIPGVTPIKGRVDVNGRPMIALGRTFYGWLHEEVLLDPKTYAYLGERAVAVKTHTTESDGEAPSTVKAGTLQRLIVRDAIAVVDEPGQRS